MQVINTYNETNLHNTLKKIYAEEFNGKTEQKFGRFTCDIITEDEIIEIQTSNLSSLKEKILFAIQQNKKIRIIHPIIEKKLIETISPSRESLSVKKSPKSQYVYSVTRGLTGIAHLLLDPLVSLEIISVEIIETRQKTEKPVQTHNKSRRHLKDYLVTEKKLVSINSKQIFRTKEDYLKLIPEKLSDCFTPPQLHKALLEMRWPEHFTNGNIKKESSYYPLLIWNLEKMGIIEKTDKNGKSWIYKIK